MRRQLVVNADDFGYARDVNQGIIEAHRNGILTATTLMANGVAFEDAVRLAKENPRLDVGCHAVLVGGTMVSDPLHHLPRSVPALIGALVRRELPVMAEIEAQVERLLGAGLQPVHIDTHKHTHLLPPVLDAVARVAERHGIRWVRRPFDFPIEAKVEAPWRRMLSRGFAGLRPRFHRALEAHGCRTTDHFAGFQLTGTLRTAELVDLLKRLPEGSTELMTHPGHCTEELRACPTRLKEARELELAALTSAEARETLKRERIQLVNFRGLEE